jgi:hypothetical protein
MFMPMMAYQNYMHKLWEMPLICAADKTIQMKEVLGSYVSAIHYNMQQAENTTCGKQPLYHGMPEIISIHYIYIHTLKNVKRMKNINKMV